MNFARAFMWGTSPGRGGRSVRRQANPGERAAEIGDCFAQISADFVVFLVRDVLLPASPIPPRYPPPYEGRAEGRDHRLVAASNSNTAAGSSRTATTRMKYRSTSWSPAPSRVAR
jgi:hypothetical protein